MNHRWPTEVADAILMQNNLAREVECSTRTGTIEIVTGVATHVSANGEHVCASAVSFTVQAGKSFADTFAEADDYSNVVINSRYPLPYHEKIGFKAFMEGPAIVAAISHLRHKPSMLIFNGDGVSHPKKCGVASHLGVYLDIPTIGCTDIAPDKHVPGLVSIQHTKDNTLYVSIGHRVTLDLADKTVAWLTDRGKLKFPITTIAAGKQLDKFRRCI